MSTATLASPTVMHFAAAVREALSDLPATEVDDLTDGLEADLTEQLADQAQDLGDPSAYADELRVAAGLPARTDRRGFGAELSALRDAPRKLARDIRDLGARNPALARVAEFLAVLRPAWWVFRAVVLAAIATIVVGRAPVNGFTVVIGIVALIVSVQFGRGRWLPFAWMKALLLAANIILVIASPFVVASWATQLNNASYSQNYAESYPDPSSSGLTMNGSPVSNVFAYDAHGNPLTDVQLFDQVGKPLNLVADPTASSNDGGPAGLVVPSQSVSGRLGWNVYPLAHVDPSQLNEDGSVRQSATPSPAIPPFATAKPLAGSISGPSPIPTSSPVPGAESTAAPSATPAP